MNKAIFYACFFLSINFLSQEISIKSFDGHYINGTLLSNDNSDLAIIVAGSGPTDRDGNNYYYKNNSLKMLADELLKNNIATFRFDKRGVGKSIGNISSENEIKFQDYILDLKEIVKYFNLNTNYQSISIIGHSEGALISMIVCQFTDVKKLITLAASSQTIISTIERQLLSQPEFIQTMSYPILEKLKKNELVDSIPPMLFNLFRPSVQPYLIDQSSYDPIKIISKLTLPTLIIQGDNDIQIEVKDAKNLDDAANNSQLNIIEGMNHILKQSEKNRSENIQTYSNPTLPIDENLVKLISEFIYEN